MGKKKSARFENLEDYQKSASETAKKVAYARKHNAVLNYQFGKPNQLKTAFDFSFSEQKEAYFLNSCSCAISLINEFLQETQDFERSGEIQDIIYWNIVPTTQNSFERWSDKNHLSPKLKKSYISDDGTPIDSQAQELSLRFGITISEENLVEFMTTYSDKKTYPRYFYLKQIEEIIKNMVGFLVDINFAREFMSNYNQKFLPQKPKYEDEIYTQIVDECPF